MSVKKKELSVTIQTKELRFAILNKTHVTARSLQASGKLNYESASHVQLSEDCENAYELLRAMSRAIAELKVEFGEYLNMALTTTNNLINKAVESGSAVVFTFHFPSNYNSACADALGNGIHDFVVCRSIYDWYRQTCPEIAEACKIDGDTSLALAKRALYKRRRPSRATYTP